MAAISNDPALWESSYARNVLLVSPSTLLFVVRTVAHLWRQERQKQNVQEIVNRGAELYDKLVGFVDELKSVGERLEQARTQLRPGAQQALHRQGQCDSSGGDAEGAGREAKEESSSGVGGRERRRRVAAAGGSCFPRTVTL